MITLKSFAKNVSYSLIANIINLVVSALAAILIPLFLKDNISEYGYYQIYLFYVSFIGFFHFGLCDGFLLKNAGKTDEEIDKKNSSFQFWVLFIFEFLIAALISVFFYLINHSFNSVLIAISFGINLLIFIPRNYLSNLLQAINHHKQNSFITIVGRSLFLLLAIVFLFLGKTNFMYYVSADIIGKLFALLYGFFACRKFVFNRFSISKANFYELSVTIAVGIKITLAGISSLVITGVVKFFIQIVWSVETYGIISFVLTLANLVLSFVTAVSIVLFPSLKATDEKTQDSLYLLLKNTLCPLLMATLFLACPGYLILSLILPQYLEGLRYLPFLFPICFFSAKATMLVQTYLQIKRLETSILLANIITIVCSSFLAFAFLFILKKLELAIPIILFSQIVRCFLSELFLSKHFHRPFLKDALLEISVISFYVVLFTISGNLKSFLAFIGIFAIYILLKERDIIASYKTIFSFFKRNK